jgi:hypothetical protein
VDDSCHCGEVALVPKCKGVESCQERGGESLALRPVHLIGQIYLLHALCRKLRGDSLAKTTSVLQGIELTTD